MLDVMKGKRTIAQLICAASIPIQTASSPFFTEAFHTLGSACHQPIAAILSHFKASRYHLIDHISLRKLEG